MHPRTSLRRMLLGILVALPLALVTVVAWNQAPSLWMLALAAPLAGFLLAAPFLRSTAKRVVQACTDHAPSEQGFCFGCGDATWIPVEP